MKISVIIPCHNVDKYIDRCIQSLKEQTIGIEELQIICIDDASSDQTKERLLFWEEEYPENVCIISLEENMRQGYARNLAFNYASCDYIFLLDADDWIERETLEKLYELAINNNADVVACRVKRDSSTDIYYFEHVDSDYQDRMINIENDADRKKLLLEHLGVGAYEKFIKRSFLLENEIFYPEGLYYEDMLWGSLMYLNMTRVYICEKFFYHYYVNSDSTILKMNELYHIDHLTVQQKMWQKWIENNYLVNYRYELEYEMMYSGYLGFVKLLCYRYSEPPYELFRLQQELIRQKIPSIDSNPYLTSESIPELHRLLIAIIYQQITKKEFCELIENVRKIGL